MLEVLTSSTKEAPVEGYVGRQYVGVDLHRRRSVVVRTTDVGDVLEAIQITNSPVADVFRCRARRAIARRSRTASSASTSTSV